MGGVKKNLYKPLSQKFFLYITTNLGGYNKCGTFSIQGVPTNARKKITKFEIGEKSIIIRNNDLVSNERFTSLVKVLGLDYNRKYDNKIDIDTLRYGCVVAATDQDDDGKGNIFGLLLNFFALFWPELVKIGYVKRLNTPIIRAFPNFYKNSKIKKLH